MKRELQIKEILTREVVDRVDVTGKSESTVERIERGMLINMDRARFYVDDVTIKGVPS